MNDWFAEDMLWVFRAERNIALISTSSSAVAAQALQHTAQLLKEAHDNTRVSMICDVHGLPIIHIFFACLQELMHSSMDCTARSAKWSLQTARTSMSNALMSIATVLGTGYSDNPCIASSNRSRQLQCRGCDEIEELLAWLRNRRIEEPHYCGVIISDTIHENFAELDACAKTSRCVTCQLLRRAFLLEQITLQDVEDLYTIPTSGSIYAKIHCTRDNIFLQAILETATPYEESAWVLCTNDDQPPAAIPPGCPLQFGQIFPKLKGLVEECHEHHTACMNLKYSSTNPSWLVHIVSSETAQLVDVSEGDASVPYVALSYSWGEPNDEHERDMLEWTRQLAAGRSTCGPRVPFRRALLPRTLQDALRITQAFGVHYIWIDRLCIPGGSNWDHEAAKMHEVFGNAYFTLAATGAERAWDPLETTRQAWDYDPRGCSIDAYRLSTIDMGLNDMRMNAPLNDRGWVLQEERLSPRILYWCAQRTYWSCSQCRPEFIEGSQGFCNDRGTKLWSHPQRFLELCHRGCTSNDLQVEWFDIIASFVRRTLYRAKDRFIAVTGMATRYLDARPRIAGTNEKEEYLAGLWRGSIQHGLSWSLVEDAKVEPRSVAKRFAPPSWSWASLPLSTKIEFPRDFQPSQHFSLLSQACDDASLDSMAAVIKGQHVDKLEVVGRCRQFACLDSAMVAWDEICIHRGHQEEFRLEKQERFLHSRDTIGGRVLSHEPRKDFVIGKLDYALASPDGVPLGHEAQLLCLETGESSMLLLLENGSGADDVLRCKRVGAANGYRGDFFSGAERQKIELI